VAQQSAAVAATVKNVEQSDKKSEAKSKSDEQRKQEQQQEMRKINTVEMQFEVDSETNEVTLNILDKETKEILRTIPERSWGDLSVAELFKVTA